MENNKIRLLAMYLTDTSRTEGIYTRMDKEASFVSLILICFDSLLGYNVQAAYYKPWLPCINITYTCFTDKRVY